MKNYKIISIIAAGALAITAGADNSQKWLKFELSGPLAGNKEENPILANLIWKIEEQLKFSDSTLNAEETLVMLTHKFSPYFSVGAGYRLARETKDGTSYKNENRPTFDLNFTIPEFASLKFDLRSRFEIRDKHNSDTYMRYRERLRLRTNWSITDFKLSPYASCELFFEDKPKDGWDTSDWFNRMRTEVGISCRPIPSIKNLTSSLYFMVQHDREDSDAAWENMNVYGLNLAYKF